MGQRSLSLSILTPERKIYRARATGVIVPAWDGLLGLLPGHAALIVPLKSGVVRVNELDNEVRRIAIGDGFIEVQRGGLARLLVEVGESEEDVDRSRAMDSASRARNRLQHRGGINIARAEASLTRALARLGAVNPLHCRCCLVCTCTPQSCKCPSNQKGK